MDERYLFRSKRIYNGEWVEGNLIIDKSRENEYKYRIKCIENSLLHAYPVYQSTICQCTGLKDKNEKLIWENDIVELYEEIHGYTWNAFVNFGNPNSGYNWGWQLEPIGECEMNTDILLWTDMDFATCTVIGNIFDNPELLGREG